MGRGRSLRLNNENYTDTLQQWYGKNWIQTLGPIVQSIKLARYPSFPAMQRDYPALEMIPREIFSPPDFDVFTGPWVNPQPEDAKKSLRAAWVTAVNERERRSKAEDLARTESNRFRTGDRFQTPAAMVIMD